MSMTTWRTSFLISARPPSIARYRRMVPAAGLVFFNSVKYSSSPAVGRVITAASTRAITEIIKEIIRGSSSSGRTSIPPRSSSEISTNENTPAIMLASAAL